MHPRVKKFIDLTDQKNSLVNEYCETFKIKSFLENDIALFRIEFSDDSNSETELLLLDINLDTLYVELKNCEIKLVHLYNNIEIISLKIDSL